MTSVLEVTVFADAADIKDDAGGTVFDDINYVSLVDAGTHGPPALVAPGRDSGRPVRPVVVPGEQVLYINTSLVPAYVIKRIS